MLRNHNKKTFYIELFHSLRLWSSDSSSIAIIVFGLSIIAYRLYYQYGQTNKIFDTFLIPAFYIIPPIIAFVFGVRAISTRQIHRQIRIASLLLVLAFSLYLVGHFLLIILLQQPEAIISFPSIADFFLLLFYPVTLIALLSFPFRRLNAADRLAFYLDAAMMMIGMTMLFWQVNLQPLFDNQAITLSEIAFIFGYTIGDIVLLFGIVVILLRDPDYGTQAPLFMLAIAFLFLYVTDIRNVYKTVFQLYSEESILDLSWLFMHFMIALSAQYQVWLSKQVQKTLPIQPDRSFKILPYVGVVFGYGLVIKMLSEQWTQPVANLLLGTVLLTVIVIIRQIIVMRENDKLRQILEENNNRLLELSLTDSLTGVSNRRALELRLAEEIARTQRYNEPLTLIMVDVDMFKSYNDSYGHLAGDVVLQGIGQILRQYARPIDMVARYGGEEFALLLPNTDLAQGIIVAERLRLLIAGYEWPHRAVTASFGVASSSGPSTQADKLQRQADVALYNAKIKRNDVQALHAV